MFHDIVKGSYSDEGGNHTFPDGVSISDIDRPEFNLVLAGDIHVPQRLNFKNTTGGYIGSVLQRTRADANRPRGWLEIEATKTSDSWDISTVFVPVRNFFTRITFDVGANTRFEDLSIPEEYFHDQSVEVTLRGSKIDVDRVSESERWKNYVTFESARGIDVVRGYEVAQSEVAVDMTQSTSLVDDLEAYLDSGFVDIGNLDREVLISEIAHV
jgi:DNA repair exonuclease SbcCD nuclease subunit